MMRYIDTDVLVIGSGGAGLTAATVAVSEGARVWLVSKDPLAGSDTKISEGIITVMGSGSSADTTEELVTNMRLQGDDLSDPAIVGAFAEDSQVAYHWLQQVGMRPRLDNNGKPEIVPIPLGGHTKARSVKHQQKGLDFGTVLRNSCSAAENQHIIEDAWALDLIMDDNRAIGALVYHAATGEFIAFSAKAIVLACGGFSSLYFPNTDTMRGNTGDAFAMALRAGASLIDMEQVQFLPFGLIHPPAFQGLLVGEPASAGLSGVIRDADGSVILDSLMLRTRAEASAAIATAVDRGKGTKNGGCYFDLTPNAKGKSGALFISINQKTMPEILRNVRAALGKNAAEFKEPWEVRPTAHYNMGGIEVDEWCRVKDLERLFAASQSMGGLHGSNRLGSTSLGKVIVFGRRAGKTAAQLANRVEGLLDKQFKDLAKIVYEKYTALLGRPGTTSSMQLVTRLQQASWQGIGPARNEADLNTLQSEITAIKADKSKVGIEPGFTWNQGFMDLVELDNMLIIAASVAESALARPHSLGAHIRSDTPPQKRSAPYSIRVKGRTVDSLTLNQVHRQRTDFTKRLGFKIQQRIKISVLRLLSRLPEKLGIAGCSACIKCKCLKGINLIKEVINPLANETAS